MKIRLTVVANMMMMVLNGDGLDDNDCGGDDNGYAKVLNMRSWVFG